MFRTIASLLLLAHLATASADPQSHYMIHCMGCHLSNGQGMPPEVPSFDNALGILAETEDGRRYLIQVPGASQSPIDDAELAELMNWMLATYAPDKDLEPFSESEVKNYRTQTLADPKTERTRLFAVNN